MGIAKKSLIDFTSQIIVFFLTFISGITLSMILGPEGRGIWVATLFANTLLHNLSCLSLEITNIYLTGKEADKAQKIHSWSVALIVIISIIVFLIAFLFEGTLRVRVFVNIPRLYYWIGVSMVPFSLYYAGWRGIMVGLGEIKRLSIVTIIYQFLQAILIIALLLILKNPLLGLIISWAIVQICLVFVLGIVLYKILNKTIFAKLDFSVLRKMLKFGVVAHIGNLATTLIVRVDWIYISNFLGSLGLGIYSQATTFTDKVALIPQAVERGAYSKVCSSDTKEAQQLIIKIFRNTLYTVALTILLIFIFGSILIYFVLPKFRDAIYPLRVLLLGTLFYALARVFAMYFSGHKGQPKIPTIIAWVFLIFNATLNYFLIKNFLLPGAAIGTTLSFSLIFLVYFHLFIRELPEFRFRDFFILKKEDILTYKSLIKEIFAKALEILWGNK